MRATLNDLNKKEEKDGKKNDKKDKSYFNYNVSWLKNRD